MGRATSDAIPAPTRDAGEPADSDRRLVEAVRQGDDRAFELLYARYQRRIHAYVLGMVSDHGRAEDVTQEVFVSALRRMRETEQPLAFKPWLYQIAKNGCIDAFRRSKRAEEVSYDAGDALAPRDHSKLIGSGPSPDAAVAAKQDLDNLCGAFGGLSDTHHEILVLRELEGHSYQEIGRRMGMSRPAVESTLFRARRRLTEEYEDIVSGARCERIEGIVVSASHGRLGTRESHRLDRHLSHCQSCRRAALAAGLDRELLARPSVRERVASRIAGLLPFPALVKFRRGAADAASLPPSGRGAQWASQLPMLSDHLSSGWGKAAAGAAILVAGVGAGAGVHRVATPSPAADRPAVVHSAPVTAEPASSGPTASVPFKPERPQPKGAVVTTGEAPERTRDRPTASKKTKTSRPERAPDSPTAADRSTPRGGGSVPSTAPDSNPASPSSDEPKQDDAPTPDKPSAKKRGGGGGGGGAAPAPAVPPVEQTVQQTAGAVNDTVDRTTDALDETTRGATGAVGDVVEGATGPGPVNGAVEPLTDTVDGAVTGAGETVDGTAGAVTGALGAVTGGRGG